MGRWCERIRSLRVARLRSAETLLRLAIALRLTTRRWITLRLTGRRIATVLLGWLTVRLLRRCTVRLRLPETLRLRRLAETLRRREARLSLRTAGRRIAALLRRAVGLTTRRIPLMLRRLTVRWLRSCRRRLIRLRCRRCRLCTEALLLRRLEPLRLAVTGARIRRTAGTRCTCRCWRRTRAWTLRLRDLRRGVTKHGLRGCLSTGRRCACLHRRHRPAAGATRRSVHEHRRSAIWARPSWCRHWEFPYPFESQW